MRTFQGGRNRQRELLSVAYGTRPEGGRSLARFPQQKRNGKSRVEGIPFNTWPARLMHRQLVVRATVHS